MEAPVLPIKLGTRLMLNPFQFPRRAAPRFMFAILLSAFVQALSSPVRGEVRMQGDANALHLYLRDATVEEALTALSAEFNVRCRTPAILDRRLTGTYGGSLRQVISRLLDGYDFVTKISRDRVELFVYGTSTPALSVNVRAPAAPARIDERAASEDSASMPVQVAVGVATAKGPNRRTRPRQNF
jgi:hypothetical protein